MNNRSNAAPATSSTPARLGALALAFTLGLGAVGCGGEVEDSATRSNPRSDAAEVTGRVSGALTSNPYSWFRWTKGDSGKILQPLSTHVCGLTMVRGEFKKDTSLQLQQINGNWIMGGANPGSNLLQMDAVCEPLSAFSVDAGVTASNLGTFSANASRNSSTTVTSLPTFAAPILSGVYGDFNGGGEQEFITLGSTATITAKKGTSSGQLIAFAAGLFVGGNNRPRYLFDDPFTPAPSIHLESGSLNPVCVGGNVPCGDIASLAGNFCFLSSVSGDFKGADEWAQVFPDQANGIWTFKGYHGEALVGSGSVFAEAQCIAFNQTHATGPVH